MTAISHVTKTFAVGQSQSASLMLNQWMLSGMQISGSHLTATSITFLVSDKGDTYYPLYDSTSTEVSITTGSYARAYSLKPTDFYPWNYVIAREGTSASPVLQTDVAQDFDFVIRST